MPSFRERIAGVLASASSAGVALRVTGDTQDRVTLDAGGRLSWGTGTATADTTLQRTASATLTLNGTLVGTLSGNATTATTLQTARTIGDASFNGSANIVPQRIIYKDTRADNYNPFTHLGVSLHLKTNATDGLTDGGTYHGVLDLVRWSDGSGGKDFQIAVTDNGNVYTRTNNTTTTWNAWRKLWSDGNDGAGSGLDADLLDGNQGSYYASTSLLESVLGDLLNVGTYDAAANAPSTKPVPVWAGGSTNYRHGMYWVVSTPGDLDFLTVDLSQREGQNADGTTPVANADWIVATNPSHNPANPNVNLTLAQVVFKWISFSAENYVAREIDAHAKSTSDPHSAAGYLTRSKADPVYSQIGHNHDADITQAINAHEGKADPHPQYLVQAEADVLYSPVTHNHNALYEPIGLVVAHEAKADPHPQYLTPGEGDARYTIIGHHHNDLYYTKGQVDSAISAIPPEIYATDGAQSRRIFVGNVAPASPLAGDIWIETLNVALQAPAAPSNLSIASPNGTTVNLSWAAWPSGAAQTRVRVQRRNGSDWTTVAPTTIFDDTASPFDTSFSDTGRAENTEYFYRVWATNAAGDGAYGYISITTANDAPAPPTGLTTSGITATAVTLSWTAPSWSDPGPSGSRFEVFLNGISVGFAATTTTTYTYTGLTERTLYTFGVRSRDSAGLTSTIATTTATTGNAAPPAPKSAASSGVTHSQATLSWAPGDPVPANGHPAGGITDFLRYRVYRNDTEIATTTNTSYTFTGLSASTAYKLEARAEDTLNSLSADNAAGSFVNITTSVNPDTTPPAAPTITYFKPVTSYGRMEVNGTWPSDADTNYGEIAYYPGNGGPVLLWEGAVTPGASFTRNFHTNGGITEAAGQTPVVNVRARDASGNWSAVAQSTYTLIESPYLLSADSSNSWRNEAGGRYNSAGNFRLIQGYYSNPALNSTGLWYYGTKIADQVHYGGRRTFTNVEIFMRRNTGGDGVPRDVSIVLHGETVNPGNAYQAGPTTYNTPTVVATLAWNGGEAWAAIPSGWWTDLINGTRKGVAIKDTDGIPYVILDSVSENGNSGKLRFTHLG